MLTPEIKKELIDKGYLKEVAHPNGELFLYNYTQLAQFDKEVFLKYPILQECRGLILDKDNKVIARGFKKFWNYEEYGVGSTLGKLPHYDSFEITDKIDGSLIIVFEYNNKMIIATRGSFGSDQAYLAKEILIKNHADFVRDLEARRIQHETKDTFLFELIGKDNRIVVQYTENKLVLLSTTNEAEINYSYNFLKNNFCYCYHFDIVDRFDGIADFTLIREKLPRNNAEGFVVRFDNGLRVKLKYEEYVRLHKILTGISSKTIWEMLKNKDDFEIILEKVPDEFMEWVKEIKKKLIAEYKEIRREAKDAYNYCLKLSNRKEQANYLLINNRSGYKRVAGIVFAMLSNKNYEEIIWKMVKPEYEQPFKKEV